MILKAEKAKIVDHFFNPKLFPLLFAIFLNAFRLRKVEKELPKEV